MNTNDLQLLQKVNDTIYHVKECSNILLPFLVQTERETATAKRKLLKDAPHIYGIIRDTVNHKKMKKNNIKRTVLICLIDCVNHVFRLKELVLI